MGAGQFCTNPGICVVLDGPDADAFAAAAPEALSTAAPQTMLTDRVASAFRAGRDRIAASAGVQEVMTSACDLRNATPYLFATTGKAWLADEDLGEEVFGPMGLPIDPARRRHDRDDRRRQIAAGPADLHDPHQRCRF
jgi:NADP-dependent aldehyde dehydrogenase